MVCPLTVLALLILSAEPAFCFPIIRETSEERIVQEFINGTKDINSKCSYGSGRVDFLCDNGRCIPEWNKCNGRYDCPGGSDESSSLCGWQTCPHDTNIRTTKEAIEAGDCRNCRTIPDGRYGDQKMWRCNDGHCINYARTCDGREDCSGNDISGYFIRLLGMGGEDESESACGWQTCPYDPNITTTNLSVRAGDCRKCSAKNGWRCNDGLCIWRRGVCNKIIDCLDESDKMPYLLCLTCHKDTPFEWDMPAYFSTDIDCTTWYDDYFTIDPTKKRCDREKSIPKCLWCDNKKDCDNGVDELGCPWYVAYILNTDVYSPAGLAFSCVCLISALWSILYKSKIARPTFEKVIYKNMTVVDDFIHNIARFVEENKESNTLYKQIRQSEERMKLLIRSLAYTFIEPQKFHEISCYIFNLEKQMQNKNKKKCIIFFQKMLGSDAASEKFMSSLKSPDCFTYLKYGWTILNDRINVNWCCGSILKVILTLFSSSLFFLDVVKDLSLYFLLRKYLDENPTTADIEVFLVNLSLGCMIFSHIVIGLYCYYNWELLFNGTQTYSLCMRIAIFFGLLLLSPLLPTIIAMNYICITSEKETLISKYRKNWPNVKVSSLINEIDSLDAHLTTNKKIHAIVRITESMLEATPQLLVILLLSVWQNAQDSQNELCHADVFGLSVLSSFLTITIAILSFNKMVKRDSIGFVGSIFLVMGYSFLLLARICAVGTIISPLHMLYFNMINKTNILNLALTVLNWVPILNVTTIDDRGSPLLPDHTWVPFYLSFTLQSLLHPYLPVAIAVIFLFLLCHVVFVFIYSQKHNPSFPSASLFDRLLHCAANIFVPLPFRDVRDKSQRRRFKEMQANILSSLVTSVLIFMGLVLAREFNALEGDEYGRFRVKFGRGSYLSALNATMHYKSPANRSLVKMEPYIHPHLNQFNLLFNFSDPISRILNVIFHAPWFIVIYISYVIGCYFLKQYYTRFHLWSSLIVEDVYNQPTAEELLRLIEDGKVVNDDDVKEEGLFGKLAWCIPTCKVMMGRCTTSCKAKSTAVGDFFHRSAHASENVV